MKKTKCRQGIEYRCPYLEKCESEFGSIDSCAIESSSLWILAKGLTENHKPWYSNNRLYSCLPIKVPRAKTFFEEEVLK